MQQPGSPTLASGRAQERLVFAEGTGTGDLRADSSQWALISSCLREKERIREMKRRVERGGEGGNGERKGDEEEIKRINSVTILLKKWSVFSPLPPEIQSRCFIR